MGEFWVGLVAGAVATAIGIATLILHTAQTWRSGRRDPSSHVVHGRPWWGEPR